MESFAIDPKMLQTFMLVLARVIGVLSSMPVLGMSQAPPKVMAGLACLIALVVTPIVTPVDSDVTMGVLQMTLATAGEAIIGFLIGFIGRFVLAAIVIGGQVCGLQMGFGIARAFDPMTNATVNPVAQIKSMVASMVFLVVNAHHMVIEALAGSFRSIPLMGLDLRAGFLEVLMNVSSAMFVVAVKFMAPIVAVILFIRVSFGIIARMIPQMSFIFAIGFAVTILLGLLTLRLLLPDMVRILERMFSDLGGDIHAVIAVLH